MGLSVGWGDLYRYNLPDQYIDITGLGRRRYRLEGTADADNWFRESEESNNSTWVGRYGSGTAGEGGGVRTHLNRFSR
jgi:hypothetical protein